MTTERAEPRPWSGSVLDALWDDFVVAWHSKDGGRIREVRASIEAAARAARGEPWPEGIVGDECWTCGQPCGHINGTRDRGEPEIERLREAGWQALRGYHMTKYMDTLPRGRHDHPVERCDDPVFIALVAALEAHRAD